MAEPKKTDKMSDTYRVGLDPIRDMRNEYFFDSFFVKKKIDMPYSKNRVYVGKYKKTGQPFYLDTSEAFRMLVTGATRSGKTFLLRAMGDRFHEAGNAVVYLPDVKDEFKCVFENTVIRTLRGNVYIKDLVTDDKVQGFDFAKNEIRWCSFQKHETGMKEVFSMELEDGSVVECSPEHKFFVRTEKGIIEKQLSDIQVGDEIVKF